MPQNILNRGGYDGPHTITSSEIAYSFPLLKEIKIFPTLKDAQDCCRNMEKHSSSYKGYPSGFLLTTCAIFTVNLKSDIKAPLFQAYTRSSYLSGYYYFKTDLENIINISSDVRLGCYKIERIELKISISKLPTGELVGAIANMEIKKNNKEENSCCII